MVMCDLPFGEPMVYCESYISRINSINVSGADNLYKTGCVEPPTGKNHVCKNIADKC